MPRSTLQRRHAFLLLASLIVLFISTAANARVRLRMDDKWRFHLGDIPLSHEGIPITNWRWTQIGNSPPNIVPYLSKHLDVTSWPTTSPNQNTFHGQSGYNIYWTLLPSIPYHHPLLHFDSMGHDVSVFLNGHFLYHHSQWNVPFSVPLPRKWLTENINSLLVLLHRTDGITGIGNVTLLPNLDLPEGPALPNYDDRGWRIVHLPHDFVIEGHYDKNADGSHGYLPTNVAWYRKYFYLPASTKGKSIWVYFEGIYRDSRFWLNGHFLGRHRSGYIGVRYNLSPYLHYGAWNTLAVRVDARGEEGWWYEGGGIYRHVWLTIANPIHITPWGVFAIPKLPSADRATLTLQIDITNNRQSSVPIRLIALVLDNTGQKVTSTSTHLLLQADHITHTQQQVTVLHPHLWSLVSPYLYRVVCILQQDHRRLDEVSTNIGIRTIEFRPNSGFYLNGKPIKIKGTCNHQDFAGLGNALPDNLQWWRIEQLKKMGSNAYRTAHDPQDESLLDACDHLGMLVMDENRHLGAVYTPKTLPDAPYSNLSDLADMIRRDRNHSCIIMWSMCNEEPLQGTPEGARLFEAMKKVVQSLDPTRPITCAMNGGWGRGITLVEDLQGGNYHPQDYDWFHKQFPDKPFFASESASTVCDRSIYTNDPQKGYVAAYDLYAPPWAQTAEVAWKAVVTRPFVAGCFVWTGFDYRGKPIPYWWPCINAHFGIMDMCGFPKDNYYYYKAWWGDKPLVHILPHWNWPGYEGKGVGLKGKPITVWCYSNASEVELFLNGQSLGKKPMPTWGHVEWNVPYQPGKLEAKAYDEAGKVVATDVVETTGPPAALHLSTNLTTLPADGEEVALIEVDIVDAQGRIVPTADNLVHFQVTGAGEIAGVGNGDPSCHQPNIANYRNAFNGKCLLIIRAGEHPGLIRIRAISNGLSSASITLKTIPSSLK